MHNDMYNYVCSYMALILATYSDVRECLIGVHNCSQLCVESDEGYMHDPATLQYAGVAFKGTLFLNVTNGSFWLFGVMNF